MIYLGADHGGYELKETIKRFLKLKGFEFKDLGNLKFDNEDDYPIYAFKVAEAVSKDKNSLGILLCRSAGGVIIAANKVKGVYAVAVVDEKSAKHAREHNNANVSGLSGDWMDENQAKEIVKTFLETNFTNEGRQVKRLNMIREYENESNQ